MSEGGRRPSHARLYALLVVMVAFWAGNFVIGKIALRELPPLMVAGLRALLAGVFIWPVYFFRAGKGDPHEEWTGSDVPLLVTLGVLGVVLNQLLFVVGLSRTSVAHAAIIVALVPILVLMIAAATGQEAITRGKIIGMLTAFTGVALLQAGDPPGGGPSRTGDLLVFLSGLTFAAFTVLGKRLATRHGSVTVNTFAYVGGALCLLPFTLWTGAQHDLGAVSRSAWLSVGYMALFPSVISYLIYSHALKRLPASRVSTFSYIQPLMATALAAMFLSERPGVGFLAGGVLVLGGVYLTARG